MNRDKLITSLGYSTHLAGLIRAVLLTDGDVLEVGTGIFSTPILHHICVPAKRKLVSYDNNMEWIEWCKAKRHSLECKYHEINYIENWDEAKIERPWDVALIDHEPEERRIEEIKRLANFAKYIIVHDSYPKWDWKFRYSEIYPLFKYKTDTRGYYPPSVVLSNFIDLTDFWEKEKEN